MKGRGKRLSLCRTPAEECERDSRTPESLCLDSVSVAPLRCPTKTYLCRVGRSDTALSPGYVEGDRTQRAARAATSRIASRRSGVQDTSPPVGQKPVQAAQTLGMFRPPESLNSARMERMRPRPWIAL